MSQTVFDDKGTAVLQKCMDCGIRMLNYSYWEGNDGPLCVLCYRNRIDGRVPPTLGGKKE